jgi:hypothetical protein
MYRTPDVRPLTPEAADSRHPASWNPNNRTTREIDARQPLTHGIPLE